MTVTSRRPLGHDLLEALAANEKLDPVAERVSKLARDLTRPKLVKELLSGTWLGHPVHPLLIALPIGTWSSAVLLDWVGGSGSERSADRLVLAGLLSAVPTAATGSSDWGDTTVASPSVRRL